MAKTPLKLITTLSLVFFLLLALYFDKATSFEAQDDEDQEEVYVLDSIYSNSTGGLLTSRRSRFLYYTMQKIKAGATCGPTANYKKKTVYCNGLWANKGKSLLYCCKKRCQDVFADNNNCGRCGKRCSAGKRCCGGVCTNVMNNRNNCGKCNKKCKKGVKCEYGYCGYA